MKRKLELLTLGAFLIAAGWAQPSALPTPPVQPIPFNHKTHIALGLTCTGCHTIAAPGDQAGFPNASFCMGCHATIKKDDPAIQALAGFAKENKRVPWVRIYKLPPVIYFSHQVHYREAKVDCTECHGPVAERSVLVKEKSTAMADCMKCHDARRAPNGCDVCHDSH
jgi:Cytochrome c7 and related cytochrome c